MIKYISLTTGGIALARSVLAAIKEIATRDHEGDWRALVNNKLKFTPISKELRTKVEGLDGLPDDCVRVLVAIYVEAAGQIQ